MLSKCFDHAAPSQVVIQVFGGDSVKSSHPFFQSRMIGVRVLDVVNACQDSDPLVEIHRPMDHAYLTGCQGDRAFSSPVRAKDRIPGQEGLQYRFDLPMVVLRKNRVGSRSRAIPDHQNRNLLPGEPPLCGPSTPFSGPSRKPAPVAPCRISETKSRRFRRCSFLSGPSNRRARPGTGVSTKKRLLF